jgi:hypothetical protein
MGSAGNEEFERSATAIQFNQTGKFSLKEAIDNALNTKRHKLPCENDTKIIIEDNFSPKEDQVPNMLDT